MIENVSSQVQSLFSPSSRKRRPITPAATRKPTAKQIPNVWIVSGPRCISGCTAGGPYLQVIKGVRDRAVDAHLEVEVGAEAQPRAAAEADDLALADVLPDVHVDRRLVAVT